MALPTPRDFLTSIFNALNTTPISLSETQACHDSNANLFKNLPNSHRAFLTTLHVLLPSPMLLQALDLLDRGLVTKISLLDDIDPKLKKVENLAQPSLSCTLPSPASGPSMALAEEKLNPRTSNCKHELHQVRSQFTRVSGRHGHHSASSSSSTVYTVYLNAWNCSCAAFAFSAFPISKSTNFQWSDFIDHADDVDLEIKEKGEEEWKFGGTFVRCDELDAIPLCKHLLACLLSVKWESVLGVYVKERWIGREEMAAIACEN